MFITAPKLVSEDAKVIADFTNVMIASSTISSYTVTAVVYSGIDASPSSIVSTLAISGQTIVATIIDGVEGCTYLLTFTATTSDSQVRVKQTYLSILPTASF